MPFPCQEKDYQVQGNDKQLDKTSYCPPGSKLIATPNDYLIDEGWRENAEGFAKVIWKMPIICKYPNHYCAFHLNGFASHHEAEALSVFSDHKISIALEEGDTSQ